jgi:acyl-coenzyme A thioesterase PaaI-like protein
MVNPGASLLVSWKRLQHLPGGAWLFSRLVNRLVPYTGSVSPRVRVLEPGHAIVTLRDHRAVRNHLRSIHAVALINLGEFASGLATLTALPEGQRGIVTSLAADYTKKARGALVAEARVPPGAAITEPVDRDAEAEIRDASGDVVAIVRARWRISPARS